MAGSLSPGQQDENDLRSGGATEEQIQSWKSDTLDTLQKGGAEPQQIKEYFGVKDPDLAAMKGHVSQNLNNYRVANSPDPQAPMSKAEMLYNQFKLGSDDTGNNGQPIAQHPAKNFVEAFQAGTQMSLSGLINRGQLPDTVLPQDADRAMRIAQQIGQTLGDLPTMAAAGTITTGVAGPVAGGAAAFALPAALRKIMMDHYEKGDIKDASDFYDRLAGTTWEAIKGATTGAATALVGPAAGAVGGPFAQFGAELATMTTVGKALEGRLPDANDFIDGAIVLGGLHAATGVSSKLRNVYANTGEPPATINDAAQSDVILKQQLLTEDPTSPPQAAEGHLVNQNVEAELNEEQAKMDAEGGRKVQVLEPVQPKSLVPEAPEIERTEDEKTILSKIGENPEEKGTSIRDKLDDFYAKNVDYLDPLLVAETAAKEQGNDFTEDDSAYNLGRRLAAHMDRVRSFVMDGTRDFHTGEINGEGLNQIYRDVPGGDLDGLRAYGMAERALELAGRGIEPWKDFDAEASERVVQDGKEKFEAINQRRIDFGNRVIDYAGEAGLFSDNQIARMKELNQKSFPFYRVQDPDVFTGKVSGGSALKRIYGSDKQILDPILSTYKNVEMLIRKAEVNVVRNKFLENTTVGDETQTMNDYLKKVPAKMVPMDVKAEELSAALRKQGVNIETEDTQFFRPEKSFLKDNQIIMYQDGRPVVYEGPPGVIDSLKRLDGDGTAMDIWGKVLAGFTKATRVGVTSDPGFGLRHFFRSQIMSGIYSQTGQIPFLHSAMSLGDFMGKSDLYKNWLYDGGAVSSWDKLDERYIETNLIETNKDAPFLDKAWNVIKSIPEASEAFIKLTDNLARFTEYKRGLEQGASRGEAAMMAREVTPDYQKVGLQRSILRTGVAFIGAHINSLDRMAQAFKEDPTGTTARLGVLTAMSAMLWAVNKDDKAIDELPDWQKNLYWNINISRMTGDNADGTSMIMRLPKPWAPGILFGSGAEVALDSFYKDHPNEGQHFAESLMSSVVPGVIPNIAQPILDQYANKNMFSGRPLVSQDKEKLLPELQYEPYTSETAKQIAKLIGYVPLVRDIGPNSDKLSSPAVVENYIKSWTGTLGGYALKVSDAGLEKAGITQPNTAHSADTLADSPFFKEFVSRYPSLKSQPLEDFYESLDKTNRVLNSIQYAGKHGDLLTAQKIMLQYPDMEMKLTGISQGISSAKKVIQNVQDNPNMQPVEKRQVIDTVLFQIGSMANMGNQMMSDFKKSVDKTKTEGK